VALSNERLVRHTDGIVHFRWKDYADGARVKVMALEADEFIRRFLLHVVPDGFVRIRHFGLLANRTRRAKLARCRALLGASPSPAEAPIESVAALMLRLTGLDIERCPVCPQGRLRVTEILAPAPARPLRVPRLLPERLAGLYGNILPITWSLMLALRARGVGAAWTTIVFKYEKEVAELLQIPANMTPGALLPVAYFKGDDFKPAQRVPARERTHWNTWGIRR
jgi:nitroreductase